MEDLDVLDYYLSTFDYPTFSGVSQAVFDDFLPVSSVAVESVEPPEIETFALSPITSSSGLKGILLDVIGPYDNVVTQYRYQQNTSSNFSYVNEITPDYPWIFSALLFILLVLCTFRMFIRVFKYHG